MSAKESAEMKEARRLILGGMTVWKAAAQAGITRHAVYQSKWYKKWKEEEGKAK